MYFDGRTQPAVTHSNAHEVKTANIFIMVTGTQISLSPILIIVRGSKFEVFTASNQELRTSYRACPAFSPVLLESGPASLHPAKRDVTSLLTSSSRREGVRNPTTSNSPPSRLSYLPLTTQNPELRTSLPDYPPHSSRYSRKSREPRTNNEIGVTRI